MKHRLAILLVLLLPVAVFADDVVTLKNGDKITGTVVDMNGGKLKIKTAYAGEVQIDWGQIQTLTTAGAVKLKLTDGELIEGKVSTTETGTLKVEGETLKSPVELDPTKVAKINETPTQWHGSIDLGYFQTGGNTRKISGIAAINLLRETDHDKFQIRADFRYGRERGVTTDRKAYGLLKYAYKFTERFYGYISEEVFHDFAKDLRVGTVTSVGVGYDFIKAEHTDLSAEAGIAYMTNDFRRSPDEGHVGARIFVHFRQDLFLGLVFTNDLTLYPNFERGRDWQGRDEAAISAGLGKGWTMRVGAIWDYDHEPPAHAFRHDVLYFATLGYKF
jgi:hypothetical protein